jgi:hypothetical protein
MLKALLASAVTVMALPALADDIRTTQPIEAGSLATDDLSLVAYFVPLADDGYEVTATWIGVDDTEARRLVMRLDEGDNVSFSLPGYEDTLFTFNREFDALNISAEPVISSVRNASL